ncbi:MAG: ribosome biogenesis GTP-binding protein YihA/YsxC [Clostridiales Family XIII bacterium]|jgi:GTP-binding protein|nr:ribosome biogenesis GTP-binding protein YihA/YsxC [Clostridiales Family XIII bacterium]
MRIVRSDLLQIAVREDQYPPEGPPEIAFAGRSNVGKSSLLNLLTGRKALARVSGNPGKTRTINFYSINGDEFRIVDLPGYGYARVSRSESEKWGAMIERYLTGRQTLTKVVLLCDIRHAPSAQDVQMYEWLTHYGLEGLIAATKADKVGRSALGRSAEAIRKGLGASMDTVIVPVSTLKKTGTERLLSEMAKLIDEFAESGNV